MEKETLLLATSLACLVVVVLLFVTLKDVKAQLDKLTGFAEAVRRKPRS